MARLTPLLVVVAALFPIGFTALAQDTTDPVGTWEAQLTGRARGSGFISVAPDGTFTSNFLAIHSGELHLEGVWDTVARRLTLDSPRDPVRCRLAARSRFSFVGSCSSPIGTIRMTLRPLVTLLEDLTGTWAGTLTLSGTQLSVRLDCQDQNAHLPYEDASWLGYFWCTGGETGPGASLVLAGGVLITGKKVIIADLGVNGTLPRWNDLYFDRGSYDPLNDTILASGRAMTGWFRPGERVRLTLARQY